MGEIKAYIGEADMEIALAYMERLSTGLAGMFTRSAADLLETERPGVPKAYNAREWIAGNYEIVAGALGLISVLIRCVHGAMADRVLEEVTA